jgi:hypothetical protein
MKLKSQIFRKRNELDGVGGRNSINNGRLQKKALALMRQFRNKVNMVNLNEDLNLRGPPSGDFTFLGLFDSTIRTRDVMLLMV